MQKDEPSTTVTAVMPDDPARIFSFHARIDCSLATSRMAWAGLCGHVIHRPPTVMTPQRLFPPGAAGGGERPRRAVGHAVWRPDPLLKSSFRCRIFLPRPLGGSRLARREMVMSARGTNGRGKGPGRGSSDLRRAGASAGAPVDRPEGIRNVALVGHSGAGKTMLLEALLAAAGTIPRMGSIVDGTTVSDSEPSEVHQQRSVVLSVAPLVVDGIKVNLLDTPGYGDFTGELRAGLRAADAALFVVSAVDGIDAATTALWAECAQLDTPRAVVVSRLDHPRANFDAALAACQSAFGQSVVPAYLPISGNGGVTGLLGLLSGQVSEYDGESPEPAVRDACSDEPAATESERGTLIEGIISESEDESLMDRYLGGEDIDVDVLVGDLETAVARGSFFPVLAASAETGLGMTELLDMLIRAFPSPLEGDLPAVTDLAGSPAGPLSCDPG